LDLHAEWRHIKTEQIASILDILWFLPEVNLDLDVISKNETLSAIYFAKGYLESNDANLVSNIFCIDTIISAKNANNHTVDLLFSYGCGKCKNHFPISFTRCPKCYAIDAMQIKETLVKKASNSNYSLL
jgi:hypothetical protein